jgi:hypothetical protein
LISAGIMVAALAAFLPLWSLTSSNFDKVEHRDAVRQTTALQTALNAQAQRLIDFGITNSVWTDAQAVVRTGYPAMRLINFPPHLIGGASTNSPATPPPLPPAPPPPAPRPRRAAHSNCSDAAARRRTDAAVTPPAPPHMPATAPTGPPSTE